MRLCVAGWLLLGALSAGLAQGGVADKVAPMAKDAHPGFEVANITPTVTGDEHQGFHLSGHRLFVENETMTSLMMFAYSVHAKQILGLPAWCGSEPFDVHGTPDVDGQPNLRQLQEMIQKLLVERFGLQMHRDKRELAIFALTVGKGGSKMKKTENPGPLPDQTGNGNRDVQTMRFTNNTMDDFALGMQYFLDKPVVNQTGLEGRYDFELKWAPNIAPESEASEVPGLFTAVQEELGLKLEATKGLAGVIVVDQVLKPTAN